MLHWRVLNLWKTKRFYSFLWLTICSEVDPIVASFSGGAVGVISSLIVVEINNVKQQEDKTCKYCHGTGTTLCEWICVTTFVSSGSFDLLKGQVCVLWIHVCLTCRHVLYVWMYLGMNVCMYIYIYMLRYAQIERKNKRVLATWLGHFYQDGFFSCFQENAFGEFRMHFLMHFFLVL